MPYFLPRKLRREYNLDNLDALDGAIAEEFAFREIDSINDIYVNGLAPT